MKPTNPPRILLVEDDPVSRAFLVAAVEALPAVGDGAAHCAQARRLV
jgi:CheY-like chemotaxis protein